MYIVPQKPWRSKTAWLTTLALLLFVLKNYLNFEIPEVDKLVELILLTATVWGVFNNPKEKKVKEDV